MFISKLPVKQGFSFNFTINTDKFNYNLGFLESKLTLYKVAGILLTVVH